MQYNWTIRPIEDTAVVEQMQRDLNNLPEALARVLVLRGIDTFERARQFFRPSLLDLHDPYLMQDMEVAAERVAEAILQQERILVYGDYDVDGTTATALMVSFLRQHGAEADFFIPDRFEHGYGLGVHGIDYARDRGASLIIALDCGITAVSEADYARAQNLDLIICDHHNPDQVIPRALAVLNPKRPDCSYPFKELSGCGVGFKLVQAVQQLLGEPLESALTYLDLVAISIASDIVPILGENRVLMVEGLRTLGKDPRLGIRKLAEQARMDLHSCSTSRIVFGLGPRINAAGRMGNAARAVELMLESDELRADELAVDLESANQRRRTLDHETLEQAMQLAEEQLSHDGRNALVLYHPDWHLGVIGIVASRLVERYYKPTIMLTSSNGDAKGSARSIQGISIYDALRACEDLLTTFGGHDYAAGLTLPANRVPDFQERFNDTVTSAITPDLLVPTIMVDAMLDLNKVDRRFMAVLKQCEPHGPDNDTPVFSAQNLEVVSEPQTVGKTGDHLKFVVRHQHDYAGLHIEAVGFGMRDSYQTVMESLRQGRPLEALFSLQENVWNGRTTLQLRLRDLRLMER